MEEPDTEKVIQGAKDAIDALTPFAEAQNIKLHLSTTCEKLMIQAVPESIRILLESGADKECPNTNGKSPLLLAAREGRAKAVAALIQAGSQVNTADHSAHTPLMHAAYRGHLEIVELLLKGGAEVNAKDRYHRTALMLATEKAHAEIVDALLAAGARPMPRR